MCMPCEQILHPPHGFHSTTSKFGCKNSSLIIFPVIPLFVVIRGIPSIKPPSLPDGAKQGVVYTRNQQIPTDLISERSETRGVILGIPLIAFFKCSALSFASSMSPFKSYSRTWRRLGWRHATLPVLFFT